MPPIIIVTGFAPFGGERINPSWEIARDLDAEVISGMLVYTFARDHTPAGPMTVLALFLVVWAVDIPMLLAFTVARFAEP